MFGIPVHLHWTFGLILLYAFYIGWSQGAGLVGIIWIVGLFIALFGCVLLHEFGHSLTARRYGVETQDIILTPIGGIARLERMPEKPRQEFLVAIAGPAVNVLIAAALFVLGKLLYDGNLWLLFKTLVADQFRPEGQEQASDLAAEMMHEPTGLLLFMPILLATNLLLVLFNLIPAFPMDGGRVFRSLLAMRLGRVRATRIAALVGQVIAVGFIGYGFWQGQFTLALIGFFVFTNARTENSMVQTDALLSRFTAKDLMRPNFTHLLANDWMQTPIGLLQQGHERNFLVFDFGGNLIGVLEEDDIVAALKKNDLSTPVADYLLRQWETVHANESLQYIYHLIRQKGHSILPVVTDGQLLGVIDEAALLHFLNLQQRLSQ